MRPFDFVEIVRTRVAELAALDDERKTFGSETHDYRFHAPHEERELVICEREIGVALPDDYRAFITRVGNGGAGPSYGVMAFRGGESEDFTDYETLAKGFAYEDEHNPTDLLQYGDGLGEPDAEDGSCSDDEQSRRQRLYWEAFDSTGALFICHHGCASRSMLIVSGPCRGQVWSDESANDAGYAPLLDASGERHTFASWYTEWLDRAFAELERLVE